MNNRDKIRDLGQRGERELDKVAKKPYGSLKLVAGGVLLCLVLIVVGKSLMGGAAVDGETTEQTTNK